jgi:hypothetical protein
MYQPGIALKMELLKAISMLKQDGGIVCCHSAWNSLGKGKASQGLITSDDSSIDQAVRVDMI